MKKRRWPEWWDWELEFTPHLLKRMEDRQFNEVDIRTMLEHARSHRRNVVDGRWVIETHHDKHPWEVIVEPDVISKLLVIKPPTQFGRIEMKESYLEVTFRHGRPIAAYLYLPRQTGEKSARTLKMEPGMVVDFGPNGNPIGIEITAPTKVTVADLNGVLGKLGLSPLKESELAPLQAA